MNREINTMENQFVCLLKEKCYLLHILLADIKKKKGSRYVNISVKVHFDSACILKEEVYTRKLIVLIKFTCEIKKNPEFKLN